MGYVALHLRSELQSLLRFATPTGRRTLKCSGNLAASEGGEAFGVQGIHG